MSTGPTINKGKSRQDYETPDDFIEAVVERFGPIAFDLAASESNNKGPKEYFFNKEENSLSMPWDELSGNLWLNPPYGIIGPWAEKCQATQAVKPTKILMLVPASVGSNWFAEYVHQKALVLFLSPRLQFKGADDPYPKDLMLCCYGWYSPDYQCWRWK